MTRSSNLGRLLGRLHVFDGEQERELQERELAEWLGVTLVTVTLTPRVEYGEFSMYNDTLHYPESVSLS